MAETGRSGLELARDELPDVVLLDLMLPGHARAGGVQGAQARPATQHIPIVMVTAKGEEIDRVVGFELGADDYIVKPFSIREVMLRVQAIVRRHSFERAPTPVLEFGALRDRQGRPPRVGERGAGRPDGARVQAPRHDVRPARPRSAAGALLRDVWQIDGDIPTRTVDTHVKRLREKLGETARCIETVRGVGYRFTATPDMSGDGTFDEVD